MPILIATLPKSQPAYGAISQPDCNTIYQRTGSGWYESNPTYSDSRDDTADWEFATPESQGMNSTTLDNGVNSLASNRSLLSVLIIRHGKLVHERYLNGSAKNQANNVHSASKSMLQALVGIAVQTGFIGSVNDRVSQYLPQYFVNAPASEQNLTIENLMSLASGLYWVEDNTEYKIQSSSDWVGGVLGQKMQSAPGTRFNYSTGNTHVLSAVLQAATGMSTCQFAEDYLFSRIGITPEHWGRDPLAVYSGGYNLYMTPREMAKFGLLYLRNGVWSGQQIVPQATVAQAQAMMWRVDATFAYAQGWWLRTISGHPMYFAWGYGGQFIYVIPDLDIVLVTSENTADGTNNREINSGRFIENYLIPSITGP